MLTELEDDLADASLYMSQRLTADGVRLYPELLRAAITSGDDGSLAATLAAPGLLARLEITTRRGQAHIKEVPQNAHVTLAESEFHRFYLRGVCRAVLALGGTHVELYRARPSVGPLSTSLQQGGSLLDADALLRDLRRNEWSDAALGLPTGPDPGLSARHPSGGR